MKIPYLIVAIILFIITYVLFWAIFLKLCPFITSAIPQGEYHKLISILVYIVIGYLFGIGLPLLTFVWGIISVMKGLWE